jgi:hypothetical protein
LSQTYSLIINWWFTGATICGHHFRKSSKH